MTTPKATKKPPAETRREGIPAPSTPEGELFHYRPIEAADWLPFSARQLKEMAYKRQVPHNGGGNRVTFTGLNIRSISDMHAVPAMADKNRPEPRLPRQRKAA